MVSRTQKIPALKTLSAHLAAQYDTERGALLGKFCVAYDARQSREANMFMTELRRASADDEESREIFEQIAREMAAERKRPNMPVATEAEIDALGPFDV